MSRYRQTHRAEHRAFTLIELLVSIVVIVVLIAILLPAMGRAKAVAQRTACATNLRSLAQAFGAFTSENNGFLPGMGQYTYSGVDTWKNDWLMTPGANPYATGTPGSGFFTQPSGGTIFPYVARSLKVYRCPSLRFEKLNSGIGSNGQFDYTMPVIFTGARADRVPPTSRITVSGKVTEVSTPLLLEELPDNAINKGWTDGGWCGTDEVTYNHLGGTNFASVDGSVVSYTPRAGAQIRASNLALYGPTGGSIAFSPSSLAWGWYNQR